MNKILSTSLLITVLSSFTFAQEVTLPTIPTLEQRLEHLVDKLEVKLEYIEGNFLAIVTTMHDNGSYVWAMPRRSGDEESNYVFSCGCIEWCYIC